MDVKPNNFFVIDASFVLAFLLDEGNIEVESVFEKHAKDEIKFVAPLLLNYEIGNGLRSKFFRKKLRAKKTKELYKKFFELEIKEKDLNYNEVLSLAMSKKLSFYDASYVYLAKQLRTELFTLDDKLQKL